jgi:hypothetical protein
MEFRLPIQSYAYNSPVVEAQAVSGQVRIQVAPKPSPVSLISHVAFVFWFAYLDRQYWHSKQWEAFLFSSFVAIVGIADLARSFLGHETIEISNESVVIRRSLVLGAARKYSVSKLADFGLHEDEDAISFLGFKYNWGWVKFASQIRTEDAERILSLLQSSGISKDLPFADPFNKHFLTLGLNG